MTAIVNKTAFSYECITSIRVKASPEKVWNLLSDGSKITQWNSTLLGLEGIIGLGQDIRIKSDLDPSRSFKLKVSEFIPMQRMVWSDGWPPFYKGNRIFTLRDVGEGIIEFTFTQSYKGLFIPLIAGSIPDFPGMMERMVSDLKNAAEG